MDEAAAVWTKTAQVSPRSGHRKIIDQSTVRTAWRLASKTPKLIRTARELSPIFGDGLMGQAAANLA